MRVLLVEDERSAAEVLAKGLREQLYLVDVAADGDAAIGQARTIEYDAVLLDVMMPGKDGFEVCRALRSAGCTTPILITSARDAVEARIEGLDAGADGYLLKPCDFAELLARLRSVIRRGARPFLAARLEIGSVVLDTRGRRVTAKGHDVRLTGREYALLEYFARRHGDVVTRGEIAEHVWDDQYDPFSNVIDVYVQRLRRKLNEAGASSIIRTRRGEGYQWIADAPT